MNCQYQLKCEIYKFHYRHCPMDEFNCDYATIMTLAEKRGYSVDGLSVMTDEELIKLMEKMGER